MSAPFKSVVKSRGKEGVFHLSVGALGLAVSICFFVVLLISGIDSPWYVSVLLAGVGVVGLWFVGDALVAIYRRREWEFYADAQQLRWITRDRFGEKIDAEIHLSEIHALVYRTDDSSVRAYLEIEFTDHSVRKLPLVGVPHRKSLLAFISYWRDAHAEIPILRLDS